VDKLRRRKFVSGAEIHAPSRYAIDFSESQDKTIQSAKDDCDINVIIRRFSSTGQIPPVSAGAFYGDFTQVEDFHHACNMVLEARDQFMRLPAETRLRFGNDPGRMIEFLQDDKNLDEARALGLCNPAAAAPEPQLVRVVADPAGAGDRPATGGPGGAASPPQG